MRIRLQVQRHQLPPAKVLWKVDASTTTAELLTQINDFFPLEAEGWGLEDYAVHLAGYELLHFQQLDALLKEDDEIVIQPLQTNDIRARNLSGRHQISHDGRHLVDGIAYGRPLLRIPARPPIHIPPRKRARLDPPTSQLQPFNQHDDQPPTQDTTELVHSHRPERQGRQKRQKHVSFSGLQDIQHDDMDLDEDDDDDEDDDFEPFPDQASEDESDVSEDSSPKLLKQAPQQAPDDASSSESDESSSDEESESDSDSDSSESESDSDSDESSSDSDAPSEESIKRQPQPFNHPPTPAQPAPTEQPVVPPYTGKSSTRNRNLRRRDAKRLAFLKSTGELPPDANRKDLAQWRKRQGEDGDVGPDDSDSEPEPESEHEPEQEPEAQPEPAAAASAKPASKPQASMVPRQLKLKQKSKPTTTADKTEEFNKKREALLAAISAGGIDVDQDLSAPPVEKATTNAESSATPTAEPAATTQPEARRARLDTAASKRLLYSSLGVRAPKTDADRQRLQEKLAGNLRKPVTRPEIKQAEQTQPQEEDEPTDSNAWKSKISLSAVECAPGQEEYYYTTPPFPFYQRWDPSQRTKKRKRGSQAFNASKTARTDEELDNSYSEYYNDGQNGDALDYDEEEASAETGAGHVEEDQEAASAQLLGEAEDTTDLPPLPSDPSTLLSLTPEACIPGAIVCFARLEVSAATNWTPSTSPVRTALIRHVSDDKKTLELQLAKRDMPRKEYDALGRRLFDKFEMITGDDEEGDDEGLLELDFAELVDPRLLVAAKEGGDAFANDESAATATGKEARHAITDVEPDMDTEA